MSMSLDGFVGSDRENRALVLGSGQALFDHVPESRHLHLVETRSFPSGIVGHVYRPQHT